MSCTGCSQAWLVMGLDACVPCSACVRETNVVGQANSCSGSDELMYN